MKALASFGTRCMISTLLGTKPRFFFIDSKFSRSSGAFSGGSGAMRAAALLRWSMALSPDFVVAVYRR